MIKINAPLTREDARILRCGDRVLLSGVIYTARDAAHLRLAETIKKGGELPFKIKDAVIYYTGPAPKKPGEIIGSAGPTTSYRMDPYSPALIKLGQTGMIGKGIRAPKVVDAMRSHGAVYFGAIGGAGALLARCVTVCEVVAYHDLGTEAIHKLEVSNMPLTVVIDSLGNDLYRIGREEYLRRRDKA